MNVTQEISLDINQTADYTLVTAKQADSASRYLKVTMMDGKDELTVPSGAVVALRALKPDGTSCTITGTRNSDGTATVELTEQVLAVAGVVQADLSVSNSGEVLSTATFLIRVGAVPLGTSVVSENEFLLLTDLISQTTAAIGACEEAVEACEEEIEDIEARTVEAIGNIDSAAVRTTAQSLTTAQKLQARQNIGAGDLLDETDDDATYMVRLVIDSSDGLMHMTGTAL